MNFLIKLLEAISNGIYQSLNEGKLTIKEKYELDKAHNKTMLDFMLYKLACQVDPTYNKEKDLVGIYTNWLVLHIKNKDLIELIRLPLEWYADGVKKNILLKQGISSDIGKYKTVEEFLSAMEPVMKTTDIKISGSEYNNREKLKDLFKILGSSKYWDIVVPLTWNAERWFGRETLWCTVANDWYFNSYSNQDLLIIFYPRNEKLLNLRIQIHFKSKQYCGVYDNAHKTIKDAIENIIENYDIAYDLVLLYNKVFKYKEQIVLQKEVFINTNDIEHFYKEKKKFKVYNGNIKKVINYCIDKFGNNCDLNWLDTSEVTDMSKLFLNKKNFNGDISKWDVSNVKDMESMFYQAESFNLPIGDWDVSNVENMYGMFCFTESFNLPIGDWDVSNVKNMGSMFLCANAFNLPIGDWDVSNVENMHGTFHGNKSFNLDIRYWDISNSKITNSMFSYTKSFNQPIGDWDVSNVKDMDSMFSHAEKFNQPLDKWDISNVKYMSRMFDNAKSFNQDISNWDISNVEVIENMFLNSSIKKEYKPIV